MDQINEIADRRTSADIVFDHLYREFLTLDIPPGTKISEVEIATRFGVSRQPVRDAFSRLANHDLLLVRPQKATTVRKFALERIAHARFVRLSVELEVLREACARWDGSAGEAFRRNLGGQERAVQGGEVDAFHTLDYDFHRLLTEVSGMPLAFKTISRSKAEVDRLCVLSLTRDDSMPPLYDDHRAILGGLEDRDIGRLDAAMRRHLGRLDATILEIREAHRDYFED